MGWFIFLVIVGVAAFIIYKIREGDRALSSHITQHQFEIQDKLASGNSCDNCANPKNNDCTYDWDEIKPNHVKVCSRHVT